MGTEPQPHRYVKRERDSQRRRVYRAEGAVMPAFAKPLATMREVTAFIEQIVDHPEIRATYPNLHTSGDLLVSGGSRRTKHACAYGGRKIVIPKHVRDTWVVCHEMAHIIVERETGGSVAGHGWQFCNVHLYLTAIFIGVEAHHALKRSYLAHGVKIAPAQEKRRRRTKAAKEQQAAAA